MDGRENKGFGFDRSTGSGFPLRQYGSQAQGETGGDDSPFYKSAAPNVSLPKGGGAMKAIDEKFSVNAVNGTAGLAIPLPLTPGRGGFTPTLSLHYDSGSGNGEFGLGWNLSLPSIQRKTNKKLPLYDDQGESDVFLLAGAEDLIPELDDNGNRIIKTSGAYTLKCYRPRMEGLFARIEYISKIGSPDTWWRVTTKDNMTTYYGLDESSRISDPENGGKIFKWLPALVLDHKGNAQRFEYESENTDNVPDTVFEKNRLNGTARFTNTYLKKVSYGNEIPYFIEGDVFTPQPPTGGWLFEVVFDYGDHTGESPAPNATWPVRSDAFSRYNAGFEIRTYRLCRRIMMFHYFTGLKDGQPALMRSLELGYHNDLNPEMLTETDYIVKATQRGYKWKYDESSQAWTAQTKTLPPLELGYAQPQWDTTIHKVPEADFQGAPQGLTGPYQWTDFEGEGIGGILTKQGQGWFYKNNLGDGHFAPPRAIARKPNAQGLGQVLQWQDLDADGGRQLSIRSGSMRGYWELQPTGATYPAEGEWAPFRPFEKNSNIGWNSPFTLHLDLDGDGRADTLIAEDRVWTWYANKGRKGYDIGGQAPVSRDEEKGPVLLLRDSIQSIFLADMSGDGLTDLVRIRNGEVCYWPNKGYGYFGAKVTMAGAPHFQRPDLYNPNYLTLADIGGTGTADLLYVGGGELMAWINKTGNGFGEGKAINPLPGTDLYSKIAVLDFLGNGTSCIVWSSPLPQHAAAPLQYIDLMGGKKPYLLESYKNGMGKEISLEYKSSTHYYLEDKKEGIYWATKLPFPVHCVDKIIIRDTVSETTYTQSYRYRHGYYDSSEREFRGFGYVETLDTDSAAMDDGSLNQPPVLTKSWYHTGAWMWEGNLVEKFKEEYFRFEGWDDFVEIAHLPKGAGWQESMEACRALKGSILRQEVYAQDGSDKENIPYSVTATAYEVKRIQPLGGNRHASFLTLQRQSVVFSCERDAEDPRILHELVLEADEYGNVLQNATVAYARKHVPGSLPQKVKDEQAETHITCTKNNYTNDAIDDATYNYYRLRLPWEEKSYELHPNALPQGNLYTVAELLTEVEAAGEVDFSAVPAAGEKRCFNHSKALFLGNDAVSVLDEGEIESLAIPYESYTLAFTPDILTESYGTKVDNAMLAEGGYVDLEDNGNYWLPSGRAVYDSPETKFYTPEIFSDPWGNQTTVSYGSNGYWLLPEAVTDAKGNVNTIEIYDWHTLQPLRMKDANDNISEISYDALGLAVAMAVKSKDDGTEGDTLDGLDIDSTNDLQLQDDFWNDPKENASDLLQGATWRCVYDLESTPVAVAMIGREKHHYQSLGLPVKTLMQFIYSDGLGREMMQKVQCEPTASNGNKGWIGTGRTIYNNKGKPVMQYEPYFSSTHECDTAEQAASDGVSPKLFYDPLGRNYRTELPDGSFTKTEWTAWEQQIWDNNDTVLESDWYLGRKDGQMGSEEKDAALKAAAHADTPTIIHTDTLARAFYTIQQDSQTTFMSSYENLDIQGNRLSVVDGRGLKPLQYRYNMLQAPCLQTSIDSGTQRTLLDVAGQPLYAWDADDKQTEIIYDVLRRPLKGITDGKALTVYAYGEDEPNDKARNLRGQLYRTYDGSGTQWIKVYDFKGNPLESNVQLLDNPALTDADWDGSPALSTEVFTGNTAYDALSRPVITTDPGGNVNEYFYDKGGVLKTVKLNGATYVQDLHYDAKGQRQAIWYGNGTKTSYTYDVLTFRLRRLLTVKLSTNTIMQDLHYWYDPVGNITQIQDDAQQTLFYANAIIDPTQRFTYDALYRLIEAEGREQLGSSSFGPEDNWNDADWCVPLGSDATRRYRQLYTYDAVGNILQLQHIAGAGSYTRDYDIDTAGNRMLGTTVGADSYSYTHDVRGNMTAMPHLDAMLWNLNSELHTIANGTMEAYYQYSGGQRVRKYVDKGSIKEERIYLGSFELYRKFDGSSSLIIERQTAHVSDDSGRIAMLEKRTYGSAGDDNGTDAELTRYIYSNHLQSASLELDEAGDIISYEEYHPYGTTSYQATNISINAVAKRYRYTGKERDEESGLYYHGARYYIPWLCRWTAVDPLEAQFPGMSPYNYGFCNPIKWKDSTGMQPDGEEKTGVWYWDDNKNKYLFDKEHTYQTFTDTKTKHKRGSEFFVLAMGKEYGEEEYGTYQYKSDGTKVYHPPIVPTDEELKADMGWAKIKGVYQYISRYDANKKGIGNGMFDFFKEGEENGVRYKRDGTKEYYKEKMYGSVNVASNKPASKPTVTPQKVAPKPQSIEPEAKPVTTEQKSGGLNTYDYISNISGIASAYPTIKSTWMYNSNGGDVRWTGKNGNYYTKSQLRMNGGYVRSMNYAQNASRNLTRLGNGLTFLSVGTSVISTGIALYDGTDNTSTWVGLGIGVGGAILTTVGSPIVVTAAAIFGVAWGISQLFYGGEINSFIDFNMGYR